MSGFLKIRDTAPVNLNMSGNAQVTHSRTGRRISHGYNPASIVAIRMGP